MSNLDLAQRFINAVSAGDEAAARDCMHTDAGIWHNYDGITQTVDDTMRTMQRMMLKSKKREYQIHRLEEINNGYVQRHSLHVTAMTDDKVYSTEVLALVTVRDGKISLVEEFLNPAPLMPLFAQEQV